MPAWTDEVKLSVLHPRHVATPEGAAFYNLPIGAPIEAHVIIEAIHKAAEIGLKPPVGGVTGGPVKEVKDITPATVKAGPSSLKGTTRFTLGAKHFNVPDGSKIIEPKDGAGWRYVLTPDGKVHAFVEGGEVKVPDEIQGQLSTHLSKDLTNDPEFKVIEGAIKTPSYHVSTLPPGHNMVDSSGKPSFKKNGDGSFNFHGTTVDEASVQKFTEDGDIAPEKTPESDHLEASFAGTEATKFSEMKPVELEKYLSGVPTGTQFHSKTDTLTKRDDGLWYTEDPSKPYGVSNFTMSHLGSVLQPGPLEDPAPADENGPDASAPDAPAAEAGAANLPDAAEAGKPDAPAAPEADTAAAEPAPVEPKAPPAPKAPQPQQKPKPAAQVGPGYVPKTAAELDAMPVGSKLTGTTASSPPTYLRKNQDGTWQIMGTGVTIKSSEMQQNLVDGKWKVHSLGTGKPVEAPQPPKVSHKQGSPVESMEDILDSPVGTKFYTDTFHGPMGFEKIGEGSYRDDDPTMGYTWDDSNIIATLNGSGLFWGKPPSDSNSDYYDTSWSVGDEVDATPEYLGSVPVGWQINDSGNGISYQRTSTGWKSSEGQSLSTEDLAAAASGAFYVTESDPSKPLGKTFPTLIGATVEPEHLPYVQAGTVLGFQTKGGDTASYVMLETGKYLTPWGSTVDPSALEASAGSGKITILKLPNSDAMLSVPSNNGVQFTTGGQVFSKDDVAVALAALNHSKSFQVSYALKDIPENPIAQQDALTLKTWAATAHPELKGVPALKATLSDKLGVQTAFLSNEEKIHLGADTPKSTNFGMTGGDFSVSEMQDAVLILENYDGKLYKSELGKQGNPLGVLSFKDLVGFEKDKGKAKQKVIDFLKAKIAKAEGSVSANSSPLDVGTAMIGAQQILDAPVGTKFVYVPTQKPYFKSDATHLQDVGPALLPPLSISGLGPAWLNGDLRVGSPEDFPQVPFSLHPGDVVHTMDQLKAAPLGTRFMVGVDVSEPMFYVKTAGGLERQGAPEIILPLDSLGPAWFVGVLSVAPEAEVSLDLQEASPVPSLLPGESVMNKQQLIDAPVGTKFLTVSASSTDLIQYTKSDQEHISTPGMGNLTILNLGPSWFHGDLKLQSLPDQSPPPKAPGSKLTNVQELIDAPVGAVLTLRDDPSYAVDWTKTAADTMTASDGSVSPITGWEWEISHGLATWKETQLPTLPSTPAYAQTPAAALTPDANGLVPVTGQQVLDAPVGTVLHSTLVPGSYYSHVTANTWLMGKHGVQTGVVGPSKVAEYASANGIGQMVLPPSNLSGVVPGKYFEYNGKPNIYLIVKADGTGLHVNSKGTVTALTAKKVKQYHDGITGKYQAYVGMPDSIPSVTPPTPKVPLSTEDIAEGTYFAGDPNEIKTATYIVKDGSVLVVKPTLTVPGSNRKVGQYVDPAWFNGAPDGAVLRDSWYNIPYVKSGGKWYRQAADKTPDLNTPMKDGDQTAYYIGDYGTAHRYQIESLPHNAPETVPTAKLKTLFSQGKLLDKYGNSYIPKGYTGKVTVFGWETTVGGLLDGKKYLDAHSDGSISSQLQAHGLYYQSNLLKQYTQDLYPDNPNLSGEEYRAAYKAKVAEVLAGVDTSGVPTGKAADLFQWDSLAQAIYPKAALEADNNEYDLGTASGKSNWIKQVSLAFGDGSTIGQGVTQMTTDERSDWISAYQHGGFAKMYAIEVTALGRNNQAHPKGWLHPGYEGNPDTNNIVWGPAVAGEISAQTQIPGNWTSLGYAMPDASIPEVNNYLIAAQMQNPTFLSQAERRKWVKFHRQGQKGLVDQLSVLAQVRKTEGQAPLSDPLVWTDDVKPAKSYDSLFDGDPNPTNWDVSKAEEFYDDHSAAIPELVTLFNEALPDMQQQYTFSSADRYSKRKAVQSYFQAKADEAYRISLIPVYTKKPQQTVKQGTHPIAEYTDQWGKEYIFKTPAGGDHFRAEVETAANNLGGRFGFNTGHAEAKEVDGQFGILMSKVPAVGDLMNPQWSSLAAQQIGDVASEHVLDWILENDDTKGDNALIRPDGRIVGIDKGRAMVTYGEWEGLSGTSAMDRNANTVYKRMFDALRSGQINHATADKAYIQMQRAITRIQRVPDSEVRSAITAGQQSRTKPYNIAYRIDGKQVPQNLDGLVSAVLDRRSRLATDFADLWSKTYKQAGYGDLPEIPKNELGSINSGLTDAELPPQVLRNKTWGRSTMVDGGGSVIGGTINLWVDKGPDGADNVRGTMFLAPKAEAALLARLKGEAVPESSTPQAVASGFEPYDTYWPSIFTGAKHANYHAVDKNYTQMKVDAVKGTLADIKNDQTQWSPDMKPNTTVNGKDAFQFFSGNRIPMEHVDQYKMMLDYYQPKAQQVVTAFETNGKVKPNLTQYAPQDVKPSGESWTNDHAGYHQEMLFLQNGDYLIKSADEVRIVPAVVAKVSLDDKQDPWVHHDAPTLAAAMPSKAVQVVKKPYTHELPSNFDADSGYKTEAKNGMPGQVNGAGGSEFEMKLPTGESIYFRDNGETNTSRGQRARVDFRGTPGAGASESQTAASLARIEETLNDYGVPVTPADLTSAELTYWREYYGILVNRAHKPGSNFEKAKAALLAEQKKVGGPKDEFIERLSESRSADQQVSFWRKLFSDAFGADAVQAMLDAHGFLPKFDHLNLHDPEAETGLPHWDRFDVTADQLRKQGVVLGSSMGSGALPKALSGGGYSAEERLRMLGGFGGGMSPGSDQTYGSSHNIYTRIYPFNTVGKFDALYDPAALLRTRAYSFHDDGYGRLEWRDGTQNPPYAAPSNPLDALKEYKAKSNHQNDDNESVLPNYASLLDTVEAYGFDYPNDRNAAIQHLKSLGITEIRGVPIEDRFVMKSNLPDAIKKIEAMTWH